MKRTRYEFHDGPPPRRGVYRVRSDGKNPNYGWRYWNGEAWGPLCTMRIYSTTQWGRKPTHLRGRVVLWGVPVREPKRADEVATLRARVAELERDRMHAGVDICEVAAAVEVVRAMEIVKEVAEVVANLHEGPFRHGFEAACEEFAHRMRPCEHCDAALAKDGAPLKSCAAGRDGDCSHQECPQNRDGEPLATGRRCPLDDDDESDRDDWMIDPEMGAKG